jgi:hypothetical protein
VDGGEQADSKGCWALVVFPLSSYYFYWLPPRPFLTSKYAIKSHYWEVLEREEEESGGRTDQE